jgi:purine-cytosine permease-like protein
MADIPKKVILRDLDDNSPTLVEIETATDLGSLIAQGVMSIFGAIANAITGGSNDEQVAQLMQQLQEKEKELENMKKMMFVLIAVVVVVLIFALRR